MTLEQLVSVFRENGISLESNALACEVYMVPNATNMGPDGVSSKPSVVQTEGRILCLFKKESEGPTVYSKRNPEDTETRLAALNVRCTVYPSDAARERSQVARVDRALRQLVQANS